MSNLILTDIPTLYIMSSDRPNLGDYVEVDPRKSVSDLETEIKGIVGEDSWYIADSDYFQGANLEGLTLDEILALSKGILEHGEAFAVLANETSPKEALKNFEALFVGLYEDEGDIDLASCDYFRFLKGYVFRNPSIPYST